MRVHMRTWAEMRYSAQLHPLLAIIVVAAGKEACDWVAHKQPSWMPLMETISCGGAIADLSQGRRSRQRHGRLAYNDSHVLHLKDGAVRQYGPPQDASEEPDVFLPVHSFLASILLSATPAAFVGGQSTSALEERGIWRLQFASGAADR